MQCSGVKSSSQSAVWLLILLTHSLYTNDLPDSECVCVYVKTLVSHLLPVVATDVQ